MGHTWRECSVSGKGGKRWGAASDGKCVPSNEMVKHKYPNVCLVHGDAVAAMFLQNMRGYGWRNSFGRSECGARAGRKIGHGHTALQTLATARFVETKVVPRCAGSCGRGAARLSPKPTCARPGRPIAAPKPRGRGRGSGRASGRALGCAAAAPSRKRSKVGGHRLTLVHGTPEFPDFGPITPAHTRSTGFCRVRVHLVVCKFWVWRTACQFWVLQSWV